MNRHESAQLENPESYFGNRMRQIKEFDMGRGIKE